LIAFPRVTWWHFTPSYSRRSGGPTYIFTVSSELSVNLPSSHSTETAAAGTTDYY
jgi:hypothetical protein